MATLREKYLKAPKKEKKAILDEYCRNTGEDRKYAIKKFRQKIRPTQEPQKRREHYDRSVSAALAGLWKIFDYPCGQRLEGLIRDELDRLRTLGELECSDETAAKLKTITSSTIDKKLEHEKEVVRAKRKYRPTHSFPLKREVPTKTAAEMDRENPGMEQIDCVEHCGSSAAGEYVNSLSVADIFSGWWEGDAVMGMGKQRTQDAVEEARGRCPFAWREMHPDNGGNIMNHHIYEYGINEGITLSRSRPYHKNDNCFVEQKNATHIRKTIGYLRYDTDQERVILSDLHRNELRDYKNFFQPVIKLVAKRKVNGKNKKQYDTPRTPYRRLMESDQLTREQKRRLTETYESLNPAELKRRIEEKVRALLRAHDRKHGSSVETIRSELQAHSVSSEIIQPDGTRCHS
jgi:hypothetical protein